MPSARTLSLAVVPLLLHALAREVHRALGLVLRAEVEPASLLGELGRAADAEGLVALLRVGSWLVAGVAIVTGLAWWRRRAEGTESADFESAFASEARVLAPLLLRPALSVLGLVSVALRPSYPYGFTLPVG